MIIKDLSFSYENKKVFDHLNLEIKDKEWLSIVGPNGSGKSTLAKLIAGVYDFEGQIENKEKKIGIVYASSDLNFILDKVSDELDLYQKEMNINEEEFLNKKNNIISIFGLKNILDCKPSKLSNSYKVLVSLSSILIYEPKILILDGTLDYLDNIMKAKVIKILQNYKKKGTLIINITHDIENTLLGDSIMLLYDGDVKLYTSKDEFFNDEKLLKKYGINMPFIVSLSNNLKYYDMVNKKYYDMNELVDDLWK